ncbi:MAG: ASKHA domain-containing protein [Alphaproteobacteria bacterium]
MSGGVTVTFVDPTGEAADKARAAVLGESFLEVAQAAGLEVPATCGGRGQCRSCRVKVLAGDLPPPTIMDEVQLGHDEVHERFRLSCQTKVIADCRVMVAPPKAEVGHQILTGTGGAEAIHRVALDSGVEKHFIQAKAPDDEHHQTSDLEEVARALGLDAEAPVSLGLPLELLRELPGALRAEGGRLTVTRFNGEIIDIEPGDSSGEKYGMAFDIGTTSIVGSLMDLETGAVLAEVGGINPQTVYGGDLMSRIAYAQFAPKRLQTLRAKVLNAVNGFAKQACAEAGVEIRHLHKVTIVGNTCMHHIFLGIDPTYVGLAPYAPAVHGAVAVPGNEVPLKTLPRARVCLLPIVAGFVGADTVAAVLATRIYDSAETRCLVDIGTNGEVVMGSRDGLMACSAPAGPALEGAQIRHGMRGAIGAIEKVEIGDDVACETIGGAPPIGICGSGLIDSVAKMLAAGVLDASGRLRTKAKDELHPALRARMVKDEGKDSFVLAWAAEAGKDEDITLTQTDIRQLQLAKGAICSGVVTLQKVMGIADAEIEELMLCGGFGNYINIESALRIRLLPELPLDKITYYGNAAALGAQVALLSETERGRADKLAREIAHVSLASQPDFQDVFVEALKFQDRLDAPVPVEG